MSYDVHDGSQGLFAAVLLVQETMESKKSAFRKGWLGVLRTVDEWWSSPDHCIIPGVPGVFPYSISVNDVCGGLEGITSLPLADAAGRQLGTAVLFRSNDVPLLHLTVVLDALDDAVVLYRPGEMPGDTASLLLSPSLHTHTGSLRGQYSLLVRQPAPAAAVSMAAAAAGTADPAAATSYSCFTWSLDLRSVCDPRTSHQVGLEDLIGGGGAHPCACRDGMEGFSCPPLDLSRLAMLYFSLRLNVTLTQPHGAGCGLEEGRSVTITTRFPSTAVDGPAAAAAVVAAAPAAPSGGPIRSGCWEPSAPPALEAVAVTTLARRQRRLTHDGVPTYPPPPAAAATPAVTVTEAVIIVRSPLTALVQAVQCSQAVLQLYPLYVTTAESFSCSLQNRPQGAGTELAFRLTFPSSTGLTGFNGSMANSRSWEGLLGAMAVGCGSLGTYSDTAGESYSVCGDAAQAANCRLNDVILLPGASAVVPFSCDMGKDRNSVSVTGVLASSADVAAFLANANITPNVETLASFFNLSCGDSLVVDASTCVGPTGRIVYTGQGFPANVCRRRPPSPPSPPPQPSPNPPSPSPPPPRTWIYPPYPPYSPDPPDPLYPIDSPPPVSTAPLAPSALSPPLLKEPSSPSASPPPSQPVQLLQATVSMSAATTTTTMATFNDKSSSHPPTYLAVGCQMCSAFQMFAAAADAEKRVGTAMGLKKEGPKKDLLLHQLHQGVREAADLHPGDECEDTVVMAEEVHTTHMASHSRDVFRAVGKLDANT
ncbi:hypothetical protein VOLCADRAFT_86009 [Volvox carteri f. nagariensis]|uniref:Uncharacterized protein n=1 Tax=Volvox carteri f. nagariensis TaxID=3068 RepID=D8THL1_VOLCA|nr:uncharacterized protein VOLCADRAFT_86009 [Volvox carteri f. nagariensis]EFJ53089.1 hypothetical protein VOLCADRAFT_86009 [Volvox carteri f. nagariensis]|eukprot:XP_002946094.1 hypothetical protein VOLCADRAFT_86009 [Volvox carteri f. nagariensis]